MEIRNTDIHLQLLTNIAFTSSSLFIPIYATLIGADGAEIGLIVGAYSLALLFSNFILGRMSDIYGRKQILASSLGLASIAAILQMFATDPPELLAVRFLLGISAGSASALIAYAADLRRDMGFFSSFASLGSAIGQAAAGLTVFLYGGTLIGPGIIRPVFLLSALLLFACFVFSLFSSEAGNGRRGRFFPHGMLSRNRSVYLSLGLRHLGATGIWAIFPIFILLLTPSEYTESQRLLLVSVLYVFNSIVQVISMRLLTPRFQASRLVFWGLALSSVTFFSFAFSKNYTELFSTQLLLGISWSFMYVGGLKYVMEKSEIKGAAVGALNSTMALSGIAGPVLGGSIASLSVSYGLSQFQGYLATIYTAALLTAASAIIFAVMERRRND